MHTSPDVTNVSLFRLKFSGTGVRETRYIGNRLGARFFSREQIANTMPRKSKRWSAEVTKHSDALDLESNVFKKRSAREIARSLKRSAEASHRGKGTPLQSAMSMLNFYINRAGTNLTASRKRTLEKAKDELRDLFKNKTPKA